MKTMNNLNRRDLVRNAAACSLAAPLVPSICSGAMGVDQMLTRPLGRTGFEATTFGLGGQASLEKVQPGMDASEIVVKAYHSGVNYFDTSNVYGPSQGFYGKAFRQLGWFQDCRATAKRSAMVFFSRQKPCCV